MPGSRQPHRTRAEAVPCLLKDQHLLAPSPSFPSFPRRFYGCSQALAAAGQQAGAFGPAADEKPTSRGPAVPTLPPRPPLGHSTAPAWRGNPPPRPQLPSGAGQVTLDRCCSGRIWAAGSWSATPSSPYPSRGFLYLALCPQPGTPCPIPRCFTPASPSLSLQCFQQNSFLASHCRPSALTPPGLLCWQGWASSS